MRKLILIFTAVLAAAGVALVLTGSRAQKLPLAKLPVRTLLAHARPLVWLDDRFLLAGLDNKIVKLDSRNATILDVVSESYYPGVGHECFSREGGRFAVTEPEKNGSSTSYANMLYRWIKDWNQPTDFEEIKTCEGWNTNPHDCTAVDYKEARGDEQAAEQLMKAAHGRTKIHSRKAQTEGRYEWAVTMEKDGPAIEVMLGQPPFFFGLDMRSSFDESSGQYFWYLATEDFDLKSPHWPLKGWWVTPEGAVTGMVILPNGPWIRPFSFLYTMRFFSCGPPCYSHMDMWAGNGQLYIGLSGKAVDAPVRGVYRLDAGGQGWEKIISGTLDNGLILSPSGCQIAYSTGGPMQIMTVCGGA
jgi:hypothetical protein